MLFPELVGPGLIGIARLASEGELLEAKRQVNYTEFETKTWLSKPKGRPMPFDWGINPYRGCEFGCKYCYARYTHEFMELRETEQFEREIFIKRFDPNVFRKELKTIPIEDGIAIGTATDPYQPAERRFRTTQRILHEFVGERGRTLSITTKSDLVARDAELLGQIARNNEVCVLMTITTLDVELARLLEPMAPRPDLRVRAIETLSNAGVQAMVLVSPVVPLITDSEANLDAVAAAAAAAGARYLWGGELFLKPCAQKAFFPFLEANYPHLVRKYREQYGTSAFLKGLYPETIARRVRAIRERHGLIHKPGRYLPKPEAEDGGQLTLFSPSSEAPPRRSTPARHTPVDYMAARRQRSR